MSAFSTLIVDIRDDVCTITLNRPQAFNSLSEAMLQALQAELDAVATDEGAISSLTPN
jgi:enoyl-CoA hydratase/carnithine racemase